MAAQPCYTLVLVRGYKYNRRACWCGSLTDEKCRTKAGPQGIARDFAMVCTSMSTAWYYMFMFTVLSWGRALDDAVPTLDPNRTRDLKARALSSFLGFFRR